jgi:hypothetical protein
MANVCVEIMNMLGIKFNVGENSFVELFIWVDFGSLEWMIILEEQNQNLLSIKIILGAKTS